jgi:hypothetical protein
MNLSRIFAFAAAVLITAFFMRAIAYGLTVPQHPVSGVSAISRSSRD